MTLPAPRSARFRVRSALRRRVSSRPLSGTTAAPDRRPARGPVDPRLLRHARTGRAGVALLALIGAGQAAATLAIAVALCWVVAPSLSRSLLLGGSRTAAIALLAGAFAARGLFSWAEQVVARRTAARVTDELRRSLLAAIVRRGPAWVASSGAGRLTTVLGTGLDSLRPWFSGYLPSLVLGVLLPPAVLVVMALVDPASALIALLTLPLVPLLGALIGWATQSRARQRWAADARLAGHFLDVVHGLGTLKAFGRAERQTAVIADLTDRHRRATMRVLRVAFLSSTALDLVGTLSVGLIAVQAGIRVAGGSMSLAPALLAILLAPEVYRPLREMAGRYHAATDATAVIADVDEILTGAAGAAGAVPGGGAVPSNGAAGSAPDSAVRPAHVQGSAGQRPAGRPNELRSSIEIGQFSIDDEFSTSGRPPQAGAARSGSRTTLSSGRLPLGGRGRGRGRTGPRSGTFSQRDRRDADGSGTDGWEHAADAGAREAAGDAGRMPEAAWARLARVGRWGVLATGLRAGYPGAVGDAVHLDELAVRAGELVALRGPSGAGKSTALRVLAGLHPAGAGAVAVGRAFHLSQRPALPHARTVAEAFPEDVTEDEVRSALRLVGLDGEVTPATPLGEHGHGISAGQRQRLALAALLHRAGRAVAATQRAADRPHRDEPGPKRHPMPVVTLLLDEPTAHLDPAAERLVVARLREFAGRGCAVLAVAHRPALLAAADRVVDLDPPASEAGAVTHPAAGPGAAALSAAVPGAAAGVVARSGISVRPVVAAGASTAGSEDSKVEGRARESAATVEGVSASGPKPTTVGGPAHESGNAVDGASASAQDARNNGGRASASGAAAERWWRRPWVAVGLGAAAVLSGLLLTGAAGWLLVRAASLPPVLTLSTAVVLVRGSAVARPLLRYLERLVAHDVAFARLGRRRARVYAELIPRVPGPRLHRRGDLLTRLVDDVDARVDGLLRGWLPAWTAAVTVLVAGAAAVLITPRLLAPLAIGVLVTAVIAPLVAGWQADRQDAATAVARAALRDAMVETVDGVEELGAGGGRSGVPESRSRMLADLEARAARTAGLAAAIAHLGWAVAVAGTALVLAGAGISAEWGAVLLLGVVALGEPLVALPEAAIARRQAAGAERRVAALTAGASTRRHGKTIGDQATGTRPDGTAAGAGATDGTATGARITDGTGAGSGARVTDGTAANRIAESGPAGEWIPDGEVRVSGLVAGWDPEAEPALDGVDLELAAGARIAVTGRSGAGKSTLGAVLGGLLAPRAGDVRVGGRVVLVGDDTGHVFASTVRENLRLAMPAATDPQLVAALRRVGLGPWLAGLADGLDTWLGTGGSTMSGGQRRRFATARALLADPALLILDEPTEGIDEAGAHALMTDLLGAASGRTVLVFAHRTEGLDLVDEIYELSSAKLNVGVI
ncbi:ATP-binding cassette subfamily C protein CydCD [Actinoplanes octamycinicus]|uniref:ATP-binding cassette subfamily C protein CydCD n=1 Tax=Actinoplanes octamycinicus TaxID=135948 RepID=A0A7W7GYZ5_9ACTN|nr:thiol reductant ABC exporter subunit CydC [Actinoplanes octamycinicus]MBB4740832.1 ATP-binding cassette subfamily C protein CydCD [Actinoplanes octamycinicus]GIE55735.1 hypothetical protein Aoc01nite_11370 [Actinoplanes octamycinicus]